MIVQITRAVDEQCRKLGRGPSRQLINKRGTRKRSNRGRRSCRSNTQPARSSRRLAKDLKRHTSGCRTEWVSGQSIILTRAFKISEKAAAKDIYLVKIRAADQTVAPGADISDFKRHVSKKLTLDAETILFDLRDLQFRVDRPHRSEKIRDRRRIVLNECARWRCKYRRSGWRQGSDAQTQVQINVVTYRIKGTANSSRQSLVSGIGIVKRPQDRLHCICLTIPATDHKVLPQQEPAKSAL